jgi:hypothetical protein
VDIEVDEVDMDVIMEDVDDDVIMVDAFSQVEDMDIDIAETSTEMEVDDTESPLSLQSDISMHLDEPILTFPPPCLLNLSSWINRHLSQAFQHAVSIIPAI